MRKWLKEGENVVMLKFGRKKGRNGNYEEKEV